MSKPRFISIGFTIALQSILLTMLLSLASFWLIQYYIKYQLNETINAASDNDQHQFNQLRQNSFYSSLSLIETLSLNSNDGHKQDLPHLMSSLERNWDSLELIHGMTQINLFSDNIVQLDSWGDTTIKTPISYLHQVAATGEPRDSFFCDTQCYYLIIAPILLESNQTVIVQLTIPAGSLLTNFLSITQTTGSLAMSQQGKITPLYLHALPTTQDDLNVMAKRYHALLQPNKPKASFFPTKTGALNVNVIRVSNNDSDANPIFLIWQRDVSKQVTFASQSIRYAFLSMMAIGLILFFSIVIFHRKITKRTYKLANTLPLLTKSDFSTAAYQLQRVNKNKGFFDELDILYDISLEVTHQLQGMTKKIELQNKHLHTMAYRDSLTNLANRQSFYEALDQQLRLLSRRTSYIGVLFMDMDGFKVINDTYGHNAGDYMLITLSTRVKEVIRKADTLYRLAGDEFVILATELETPNNLTVLANKILDVMRPIVMYKGHALQGSLSIGGVMTNDSKLHSDQLLHTADEAMYDSKSHGKNRYTFHGIITHSDSTTNHQSL